MQKHDGGLITAIRNDTDNKMDNRMTITWKQKWEGKQLYVRFKRKINNISHDRSNPIRCYLSGPERTWERWQ